MDTVSPEVPAKSNIERETFGAYVQIVGPVFYSRQLSDKSKLLYGLLCAMTQAPRYYAFPRNRTLVKFLDCSERTLQRCISELEAAGEIRVVGDRGGKSLRKIYVERLQPVYPDKNDGVPPDKNDGGNKNKQKKKKNSAAATKEEILEWLDAWAANLNLSSGETISLCKDLHAMVDNREAKGKPYNTIHAAGLMTNRLLAYSSGAECPSGMMRYILQESVSHNWEKVFPVKPEHLGDYYEFLRREYDLEEAPQQSEDGSDAGWL